MLKPKKPKRFFSKKPILPKIEEEPTLETKTTTIYCCDCDSIFLLQDLIDKCPNGNVENVKLQINVYAEDSAELELYTETIVWKSKEEIQASFEERKRLYKDRIKIYNEHVKRYNVAMEKYKKDLDCYKQFFNY